MITDDKESKIERLSQREDNPKETNTLPVNNSPINETFTNESPKDYNGVYYSNYKAEWFDNYFFDDKTIIIPSHLSAAEKVNILNMYKTSYYK